MQFTPTHATPIRPRHPPQLFTPDPPTPETAATSSFCRGGGWISLPPRSILPHARKVPAGGYGEHPGQRFTLPAQAIQHSGQKGADCLSF